MMFIRVMMMMMMILKWIFKCHSNPFKPQMVCRSDSNTRYNLEIELISDGKLRCPLNCATGFERSVKSKINILAHSSRSCVVLRS